MKVIFPKKLMRKQAEKIFLKNGDFYKKIRLEKRQNFNAEISRKKSQKLKRKQAEKYFLKK
jgi:hypothetical protein